MTLLLNVGRRLHARVRNFFDAPPDGSALPLELLQSALDQLERQTKPAGRGSRIFPYNRIVVHVRRPGLDLDRAAIEAVFSRLEMRLRERLEELRCEMPADLQACVAFDGSDAAGGSVVWVECSRDQDVASRSDSAREPLALRVSVLKGQCEHTEYTFQESGIAIGRGAEPADSFGRVRHNHIAFMDVRDGVSETVARAHARLQFDPASRSYHLFNESGSNPTFVRRDGRSLRLAPRDPHGMRVQSGDELQLGRAILKLTICRT